MGRDFPHRFRPITVEHWHITEDQPRKPGSLKTALIKNTGGEGGFSLDVPTDVVTAGGKLSFESSTNAGAILVTKHKTFREDAERLGRFRRHIQENYKTWLEFANDNDHDIEVQDIILVTGRDMTEDFSMIAFSQSSREISFQFEAGVSQLASASVSGWGSWRCEYPVFENWGPQERRHPSRILPDTIPDSTPPSGDPSSDTAQNPDYNQCVFLRGFRIHFRARIFPKVVKAGAGDHDLGSGDHDNEDDLMAGSQSEYDASLSLEEADAYRSGHFSQFPSGSSSVVEEEAIAVHDVPKVL